MIGPSRCGVELQISIVSIAHLCYDVSNAHILSRRKDANMTSSIQPRKQPQQARSKQRVEAIVQAARELVGRRGSDGVSVREIAAHAGVPISSVYQYFPDKNAILWQLMERYLAKIRTEVMHAFGDINTDEDLFVAVETALDAFLRVLSEDDGFATIWAGALANPDLLQLDVDDSVKVAGYLAEQFSVRLPTASYEDLFDVALLTIHIAGSAVRLSFCLERAMGERLIGELKTLIRLRIEDLLGKYGI